MTPRSVGEHLAVVIKMSDFASCRVAVIAPAHGAQQAMLVQEGYLQNLRRINACVLVGNEGSSADISAIEFCSCHVGRSSLLTATTPKPPCRLPGIWLLWLYEGRLNGPVAPLPGPDFEHAAALRNWSSHGDDSTTLAAMGGTARRKLHTADTAMHTGRISRGTNACLDTRDQLA